MKKAQESSAPVASPSVSPAAKKSNDELWGKMVIVVLLLGLLASVGFLALLGYRIYDERSAPSPSIAEIPKNPEPIAQSEDTKTPATETAPVTETEKTPASVDAKQTEITILNAGGGGGVAGQLASSLKEAGYTKTTAGNSSATYTGVTVFYKAGQESPAKAILAEVVKKYPKATTAPADAKRPETGSAPVTIIIGQ